MRMSATPACRRLRKHLPFGLMYSGAHLSPKERAEHEAAHIVAAIAVGGVALFAHVGDTFGEKKLGKGDGMFAAMVPPASLGIVAVAGMVQNESEKLGPMDAEMLMGWLSIHVGPYPSRHRAETKSLCSEAVDDATDILHLHTSAVSACAEIILSGDGLDGRIFHRVFREYSPTPPLRTVDIRREWAAAIHGGDMHSLLPSEFWGVCTMARDELLLRSKKGAASS